MSVSFCPAGRRSLFLGKPMRLLQCCVFTQALSSSRCKACRDEYSRQWHEEVQKLPPDRSANVEYKVCAHCHAAKAVRRVLPRQSHPRWPQQPMPPSLFRKRAPHNTVMSCYKDESGEGCECVSEVSSPLEHMYIVDTVTPSGAQCLQRGCCSLIIG